MPRHGFAMPRHEVFQSKTQDWHAAACRGMLASGFYMESSKSAHAAAWISQAAACSWTVSKIASFDSFSLSFTRSLIILLEHHLQHENTYQNVQNR